jgi:hypothetical protein
VVCVTIDNPEYWNPEMGTDMAANRCGIIPNSEDAADVTPQLAKNVVTTVIDNNDTSLPLLSAAA